MRSPGKNSPHADDRNRGEREEGRKGGREEGRKGGREDAEADARGEELLAAHDCGFAGSGGFFS